VANEGQFDRRTILTFAFGGPTAVTVAAGMFGVAVDDAVAGQGATRAPARTVRRIVTAHNAEGRSFIAVDDSVPMADIWRTQPDRPIGTVPGDEKLLVGRATGETRFFLAAIPPSTDPKPNLQNRLGFHRTGGIAYCYILNGELVFLVDTQEVRIKAGDLVVERNTMHSWRNEGTEPVTMAITVVTAVA
jgi:cupin domain